MKNRLIFLLLLFCSLSSSAQSFLAVRGTGEVIIQDRALHEDFQAIHASNGLNVYVTAGDTARLEVEADENLHEIIVTKVSNGTLKITTNKNIGRSTKKNVYVTYTKLNSLHANAGADIESTNLLKAQELNLICNSGGEIEVEVLSEYINASASSGGDIELEGKSINIDADASSGGEVDAANLKVLHADAKASSGGSVKVYAKESLKAKATSGGKVEYYGAPKETEIQAGYSGRIKKRTNS